MAHVECKLPRAICAEGVKSPAKEAVKFGKVRRSAKVIEPPPDALGIVGAVSPAQLLEIIELGGGSLASKYNLHG